MVVFPQTSGIFDSEDDTSVMDGHGTGSNHEHHDSHSLRTVLRTDSTTADAEDNKVASPSSTYLYGTLTPHDGNCPRPPVEIDGWQGGCTWISQDCDDCFTKWSLVISNSGVATFTGVTREGYTAIYQSTTFRCYDRSTMVQTYCDPELYGLPHCICIAPLNVTINDPNCSQSFCDDGALTRDWVHNDGYVCEVLAIPEGTYSYPRGVDLPPEVGDGDSLGRCNYFWQTFNYTSDVDCSRWSPGFGGLVGVLILSGDETKEGCTGNPSDPNDPDRSVEYQFWCYDFDLGQWVFQGSQCGLYYCCDPSVSPIEFSASCCCEVVTTCGDCNPPETLYADDGTTTVTLTWNGSEWYGQAPVDTPFCGYTPPSGERVPVVLYCVADADYNLNVNADDCGTATATCDPFEATFTTCCTLTVTE